MPWSLGPPVKHRALREFFKIIVEGRPLMLIIPAVDLMDGKCVRLIKGDPSKRKVYFNKPIEAAKMFFDQGAKLIHLVDLDAAIGLGANNESIKQILDAYPSKVQVAGGIRTFDRASELLNLGALRVVFGTACIENPEAVEKTISSFGSARVAVALDVRGGKVAIHGWRKTLDINYLDLARRLESIGVGRIVLTCVDVDGTLAGPSLRLIGDLMRAVRVPVIASGGIQSPVDIANLSRFGLEGVIVGIAFYEGKFSFMEALEAAKDVG